jgi:hypothetical protein
MFNGGTGQHQFSSSKLLCLYIFFHIFMSYDGHVILFITDYFAHLYFVTYTYMSYDCHVIMFMTDDFAHIYFVTFLCHMNDCHVLFMTDLRGGDIRGNTYLCLYNFTLDFFSMVHIHKTCLYNIFCM